MPQPPTVLPPLMFFNRHQAAVVDAMTARIIPSETGSPGAREAQAVIYIDRVLAGYFSSLQVLYREGIETVEVMTKVRFGKSFIELVDGQQDQMLREMESSEKSGKASQFFAVVYEHTIEGTFGDPIYGGNANAVGWRLIGFPGAQWGYSKGQLARGFDARTIPIVTLADIQKKVSSGQLK